MPRFSLFALAGALLLLSPGARVAAAAQMTDLQGTYLLDTKQSDNIGKAIDTTVGRMNFIAKPIARHRLRDTSKPSQKIAFSFPDTQVSIALDSEKPILTPADGKPIKWKDDDETFDTSTRWSGEALAQTFKGSDGQRVNAYSLGGDGQTMIVAVTISSPNLPRPLQYKLVYKRAPAP